MSSIPHVWTRRPLGAIALAAAMGLLGLAFTPDAGEAPAVAPAGVKPPRYVGANKCKNCHRSKSVGNQYGKWAETKHAGAYETLASEAALEAGKAKGIDDPQKADECLRCHVTGFGQPKEAFARSFKMEKGVQCESCHGPGEKHVKARMAAAMNDDEDAPVVVDPSEINYRPTREDCVKCHNEDSPFYKPFCFCERILQIRHLRPNRERSAEEEKALHTCAEKDACSKDATCKTDACPLEKAGS